MLRSSEPRLVFRRSEHATALPTNFLSKMRLRNAISIILHISLLSNIRANFIGNFVNTLTSYIIPDMIYQQTPSSPVRGISNPSTDTKSTETKDSETNLTDNACFRLELAQIRLNALKNFVRERKEYLEETRRNGMQVTEKLVQLVRLDLNIAENDVKMIEKLLNQPELFIDPSPS